MSERLPGLPSAVEPSWKYLETNGAARTWQGPEFYVEVTKRNGDDDDLKSLKIMQRAIERVFKREKLSSGHREFEGVSQLERNPSQNYTGCTFKFLLQSLSLNHRGKEGLQSLIQTTRIEILCMKQTVFFLTSELLVPLIYSNEFSSHDIVLHTKWDAKVFPVPLFLTNRLNGTIHQNLKFN